jgi:hypothetical protein
MLKHTRTAAVKHYNGTINHIALIPGTEDYHGLLSRLAVSFSVPQQSFLERWHRRLNKSLGRPSTVDVGILSEMLSSLRQASEKHLAVSLNRVVVTAPQLPGLIREDLADAIEFAGLGSWLEYPLPYPTMLYAPNAAYAGNGHGLCKEWKNVYACWEEAEIGEIPRETVLGVTYTNTTLQASVSRITYAFDKTTDRHAAFPELGYHSLPKYRDPEEYWAEVVSQLKRFLDGISQSGIQVTEVILMGEKAGEEEFATALKNASGGGNTKVATVVEPTWAAARGAAMYARVRQEVPWNCSEPQECETESRDGTREKKEEL